MLVSRLSVRAVCLAALAIAGCGLDETTLSPPPPDGGADQVGGGSGGKPQDAAIDVSGSGGTLGTGGTTGSGGASGSGGTGGGGACQPAECPVVPLPAPPACPDGTNARKYQCARASDGKCGWTLPPCKVTCGPVCDIFCQYGNVKDANGCPTCRCNPAPEPGPKMCDRNRCPSPAPGAPNVLCPDGKTLAGPACLLQPDGTCNWNIISCPTMCVQNVACSLGTKWDSVQCRCVPTGDGCACPAEQLCVSDSGARLPAATAGAAPNLVPVPTPRCESPNPACASSPMVDPCSCLSTATRKCERFANSPRLCLCSGS